MTDKEAITPITPFDSWWDQFGKAILNRHHCAEAAIAAQAKSCVWTEDPDGIWNGPCGVAWEFTNAGPVENECNFCPRCGGTIETHPYEDEEGEPDE